VQDSVDLACRLAYKSQLENKMDRGLSKVRCIRNHLGGSAYMPGPFPDKPRGMHWRTYDRLVTTAYKAMMHVSGELQAWTNKVWTRFPDRGG
jgi:hypothetical protein